MKKLLLEGTLVVALAAGGAANAADLPTKAPPPIVAPVPFSWTGIYLGGHFGAGWGSKDWDFVENNDHGVVQSVDFSNSFPVNGFLGGGQLGGRLQLGSFVLGVEGTFSGADIKGKNFCESTLLFVAVNCASKVDWLASVSGEVGFAVDHALLYVKGGIAWVHDKNDLIPSFPGCGTSFTCAFSNSQTRTGGLFGAGIAYAFLPNWSVFIEYNYMDLGNRSATFSTFTSPTNFRTNTFDIDQRMHVVKAGLNWQFNWGKAPTPVVARY